MSTTPFKFLDSYTSEDRDIFFGRESEVEELYYKIFDGKMLIVYGSSGTGKTSLIQCGLAIKFQDADWMPVTVRRAENLNDSLHRILQQLAQTRLREKNSLAQNVKSVYLDFFKPLYLLFDQFEELFIFGSDEEIEKFTNDLHDALTEDIPCKYIFVIRGEYLEHIARFEERIPEFFNNRMRIERMTRANAARVITQPATLFHIEVAESFPALALEKLGGSKSSVELTYLQVYLDKLYKKAVTLNPQRPLFNDELLESTGQIDDVLAEFLDEQVSKTENREDALAILKSFVSSEGTKKQMSADEVLEFTRNLGKSLSIESVERNIRQFVDLRILKDKDENNKYELRHDALASKIYEQISLVEKEILEVRQFLTSRFVDFQRRSSLLEDADLQYIKPYETRLFLSDEEKQFIERSKRSVRQKRNRRRNIAAGAGLILILVLTGFTIFAIKQRNEAVAQTKIAQQKTQEAINQKELAEKSEEMAMNASKQALDAKSFAELQAKIADEQKLIAEKQAVRAKEQSQFATEQQGIAEAQKTFAEEQKLLAEQKSGEALQQKQKADSAKSESNRLRLLTLSQAIAFKSLQQKGDADLAALLAYESYKLNKDNGGNPQDPQVYSALYESLKSKGNASTVIRSKNSVKAIGVSSANQNIFVIGADGSLNTYSGTDFTQQNSVHISGALAPLNTGYVSPDGRFAATAYEDNSVVFYDINNAKALSPLKGHAGLVRAVAFGNADNMFATGGRDSTVIIWENGAPGQKIHFDARIRGLFLSPDNKNLAVGSEAGTMWLVNVASGEKKLIGTNNARIHCAAFSTQGSYSGFGGSNSTIYLFRTSGNPLRTLADNTTSIDFIALDEGLEVLVSGAGNKIVHIYTLDDLTQKPIVIKDVTSPIVSMVLARDGRVLVCSSDNNIRQFYAKTEQLQSLIYSQLSRNLTSDEWTTYIGADVPYQKIKPDLP